MTREADTLEFEKVSKTFPGARALSEVSFTVRRGEIHSLLGENGAGKSTVVNLIAGVFQPDSGVIRLAGQPVTFHDPRDSLLRGVATIHQELALIPEISVAENVYLGHLPRRRGRVRWSELRRRTEAVLSRVGLDVPPTILAKRLSTGEQQLVEIARAIALEPRLLLMDEPTSALSATEVERLFSVVRALRDRGLSVIFISHRLEEVWEMADRLTVLRDGRMVLTRRIAEVTQHELAKTMIGHAVDQQQRTAVHRTNDDKPALSVKGLTTDKLERVEFMVRSGEIVGLAGALGAGKTELLRAIYGVDRIVAGKVLINGKRAYLDTPRSSVRHRMFLVPEDRKAEGLVLEMSVAENTTLPFLESFGQLGALSRRRALASARKLANEFSIKASGLDRPVRQLSGGNQQKVILARWIAMKPRILLLDQPTRGLDIGAKEEVYRIIQELSSQGVAIVFVATEIPELLRLCDRIYVMRSGAIVREFDGPTCSEKDVFTAAFGDSGVREPDHGAAGRDGRQAPPPVGSQPSVERGAG